MKLYRYLSFEKFKDIVDTKKLYFANPFVDWKDLDDQEGFLFKNAKEGDMSAKVKSHPLLEEQLMNGCLDTNENTEKKLDWFGMRCICWSKTKCSRYMAEAYKADVCIEIDSSKLLRLYYNKHKVEGQNVKYYAEEDLNIERIDETIGRVGQFNFLKVLMMKNKRFEKENEYRSSITLLDCDGHFEDDKHDGVYVSLDENNMSIGEFIEKVYIVESVSPEDGVEIENICEENGIKTATWNLIETERLIITEFKMDMAKIVQENSIDEDNKRFVPDEVWESVQEAEETLEYLISQYGAFDGPLVYPIIVKKTNDNVGYVQLVPLDDGKWEIGYHIAKRYTGNGYATEAVKAFLPVITEEAGLTEVYGICLAENKASCAVMKKAGFTNVYSGIGKYQGVDREIIKNVWKARVDKVLE